MSLANANSLKKVALLHVGKHLCEVNHSMVAYWMWCCEVVASLYGQDLDSGHHGSGFPLPPFRQRLLEAHLAATEGDQAKKRRDFTPEEIVYSEHKWNINNMPRCKVCISFVHTCCASTQALLTVL